MAAERYRRFERVGEGPNDARDTQTNGRSIPTEEWKDVHADFLDPTTSGWTGFAGDGAYYEAGFPVPAGPSGALSTDDYGLNGNLWTETAVGLPHLFLDPQIKCTPAGNAGDFLHLAGVGRSGRAWQLRGDFRVELFVPSVAPAVGSGEGAGQDCAVILGVSRLSEPLEYYRGKYFRTPTREGFAAEIGGATEYEGEVAQVTDAFVLVLERTAGVLRIYARYDVAADRSGGELTADLYNDVAPGIMTVVIHVRDQAAAPWSVDLEDFRLVRGWTDYSHLASWYRERDGIVVLDEFEGDEADPDLWTLDSAGAGNAVVVDGNELALITSKGPGVYAEAAFPTLTGDFDLAFNVRWRRTKSHVAQIGVTDVPFRLTVRPEDDQARFHAKVTYDDSSTRFYITTQDNDAALESIQDLADDLPWDIAIEMRTRWYVTRSGETFRVRVEDLETGQIIGDLAEVPLVEYVPSLPVRIILRGDMTSIGGESAFYVSAWTLRSPHGLRSDVSAWPSWYYGAAQIGDYPEVTPMVPASAPHLADLTLIDVTTHHPFWRIVSASDSAAEVSSDQALRPGEILDSYAHPTDGLIVIPVNRPDSPGIEAFVEVNLGDDCIYQVESAQRFTSPGPVRWRHLGLPVTTPDPITERFIAGSPIRHEIVATTTPAGARRLHVWATSAGIKVAAWDDGVYQGAVDICRQSHEPGIPMVVTRIAVVQPWTTKPAGLVVLAQRDGDTVVFVYRDLEAAYLAGDEVAHAGSRSMGYSGQSASANNQGVGWVTNALYRVGDDDGDHVFARWTPTEGQIMLAVTRPGGMTLLRETDTLPKTVHFSWPAAEVPGGHPAPQASHEVLAATPRAVWFSEDARLIDTEGVGTLVHQSQDIEQIGFELFIPVGAVQVIALETMGVVHSVSPVDVGADQGQPGGFGVMAIPNPPGVQAGLRLVWGYGMAQLTTGNVANAIVEYELWAVTSGPWTGPHIGGTEIAIDGWGLEEVVRVEVGGVEAFRLAWEDQNVRPGFGPTLYAVVRALGWIERNEPAMPDADLEATEFWPYDVTLTTLDGLVMTLPGAYTYESRLCIERSLARLAMRLPDEVLMNDPKADTLQRHILVGVAWEVCQVLEEFLDIIERDTYRAEAQGEGLDAWGGSYGVGERPLAGMDDAAFAAFILARAFGPVVTVKAIKDLIEPIFGYRPVVEESYREFTVVFDPALAAAPEWRFNFFGGAGALAPLRTGFHNRDFYGGPDARVVAARAVLDFCRAAGVRANVRIESA